MARISELFRRIINKPIQDIYGRHAGHVICVHPPVHEEDKHKVAVEHGDGIVKHYREEHFHFEGDTAFLHPLWRIELERVLREFKRYRDRIMALDQLIQSGEISQRVYDELLREYKSKHDEYASKIREFEIALRSRLEELDENLRTLELYVADLEVRKVTGKIPEEAYAVLIDNLNRTRARVESEKKDIEELLKFIASLTGVTAES